MKEWYNDIDSATLQRIKTYSAFNDAQSKNLMVQTMYEYREKEIQDFKETNHELALESIARQKRIAELEEENAELKSEKGCETCTKFDEAKLTEAKRIIRALLFHLSKDTFAVIYETKEESIKRAEQFLSEVEKCM